MDRVLRKTDAMRRHVHVMRTSNIQAKTDVMKRHLDVMRTSTTKHLKLRRCEQVSENLAWKNEDWSKIGGWRWYES